MNDHHLKAAGPRCHEFEASHATRGRSLSVLRGAIARYRAWRRRRIAVRHLSDFDDYLLRDIGISRSEIVHVTRHGRPRGLV
jgi:uncharacterized protein YjiS (DUF1127 family)